MEKKAFCYNVLFWEKVCSHISPILFPDYPHKINISKAPAIFRICMELLPLYLPFFVSFDVGFASVANRNNDDTHSRSRDFAFL